MNMKTDSPTLYGMKVVINDASVPGYVLPEDLSLPPEFRKQFNEWAAGFFKRKYVLAEGLTFMVGDHTMTMRSSTYAALKKEAKSDERSKTHAYSFFSF